MQGILHVEDLGSRNGTYIDGVRIRGEQRLGPGQALVIGATRFEVLSADDQANADPTLTDAKPIATPRSRSKRAPTVTQAPATVDLAPPYTAPADAAEPTPAPAPSAPRKASPRPAQDAVLQRLGRFIVDVTDQAYYRALELDAEASDDALRAKLKHYQAFIAEAAPLLGAAHAPQLRQATTAIDKMRTALLEQRLEYDLSKDIVRADARWAAAQSGRGPSVEVLHKTWSQLFPERVKRAHTLATHAAQLRKEGRLADAVKKGKRAMQADPFSAELRDRVLFWQNLLTAQR